MLTIKNYVRPQSPEEAYTLAQKKSNVVLGGMLWLKMQNRTVNTAIDLCDLGLDRITRQADGWHIGAMVSLRTLETHEGLNAQTRGAFSEAVKHIVGVQFRNCATVGGSLWGRFGFSDVLTLFAVLEAKVVLQGRGVLTIAEFEDLPRTARDLLLEVIVPDRPMEVCYRSQRNTATDFPVLACAVSRMDGVVRCAVGARPAKAICHTDEKGLLSAGITRESAEAFARDVAEKTVFASNVRAGAEYRKLVCAVLIRRALTELEA